MTGRFEDRFDLQAVTHVCLNVGERGYRLIRPRCYFEGRPWAGDPTVDRVTVAGGWERPNRLSRGAVIEPTEPTLLVPFIAYLGPMAFTDRLRGAGSSR